MTEQQIRDGYDRLDGALAPPLDAAQRVERRVAARRRHRRTAVAGVAALGVLAVGGTVVALVGGDDGTGPQVATDPGSDPVSTLVMTRPDGSTYAFDDVTVSCRPPAGEEGRAPGESIWMTSPRKLDGQRALEPFLYFQGVVAKLQGDRTLTLPVDGPGGSETYPMVLFIGDSEGAARSNELSSAEMESRGTVRVLRAACEPVPVLELQVDAALGSELEQNSVDVAGELH